MNCPSCNTEMIEDGGVAVAECSNGHFPIKIHLDEMLLIFCDGKYNIQHDLRFNEAAVTNKEGFVELPFIPDWTDIPALINKIDRVFGLKAFW
jgi:hypothetical protein